MEPLVRPAPRVSLVYLVRRVLLALELLEPRVLSVFQALLEPRVLRAVMALQAQQASSA